MKNKKITREEVEHIAKLARLVLSESEIAKFQNQLSDILEYMENLERIEVSDIEPTSQITGLENIFREDKVKTGLSQEEALSQTKEKEDGFFKIKAIFEEEDGTL